MKNQDLHLRITKCDFELIKRIAVQRNLTVSRFILSLVIPVCCKIDSQGKDGEK